MNWRSRISRAPGMACKLLALGLGLIISPSVALALPGSPAGQAPATIQENYGRLPCYFTENRGQVDPRIKYYERGRQHAIYFTREGIQFVFRQPPQAGDPTLRQVGKVSPREVRQNRNRRPAELSGLKLIPVGMNSKVELAALQPQPGKVNYLVGKDPTNWHTEIATYGAVLYRQAYPGIDLKFYSTGRQLEYDIIAQPGAALGKIKFQYQGARKLKVTPGGDLAITLARGGTLIQKKPLIYQEDEGTRVPREGRFKILPGRAGYYSFEVAAYDKRLPLIIDPILVYSSYLGSGDYDTGNAIAVDQDDNLYVTGATFSQFDFPFKGGMYSWTGGSVDAFISKINPDGSAMVYSTYLGGLNLSGDSVEAYGIAVSSDGCAYVTGFTDANHFPTKTPLKAL